MTINVKRDITWRLTVTTLLFVIALFASAVPALAHNGNSNAHASGNGNSNAHSEGDAHKANGNSKAKGHSKANGNSNSNGNGNGHGGPNPNHFDHEGKPCKGNHNNRGNDPCDRHDHDDDGGPITPGAPIHACPPGAVPASAFTDITGNVHRVNIDCITWWKLALGVTSTKYAPGKLVTRAQTASFIARLIDETGGNLPQAPAQGFNDVGSSVHANNINRLAASGIIRGVTPTRFAPRAKVTRAQMVTMLVGAYERVAQVGMAPGPDAFDDDNNSVHQANINKAANAGLVLGTGVRTFAPTTRTQRDQMASFLARLLDQLVDAGHGTPPHLR